MRVSPDNLDSNNASTICLSVVILNLQLRCKSRVFYRQLVHCGRYIERKMIYGMMH